MDNIAKAAGDITIREMREQDVDGILTINTKLKGSHRAPTYEPVPESCIGGDVAMSVVAEVNSQIVGFVLGRVATSLFELRHIAWIEMIGILPDYQRQGLGTRLVEAWKERCRQKGIARVHIMVYRGDSWLQSFLESLGFSQGELADFQTGL